MKRNLQNPVPSNSKSVISERILKISSMLIAVLPKVLILFLILGFWRNSYAQPVTSDRLQLYSQSNFSNAFWHTPINPLGARIGFNGLQHFTIMNHDPTGWLYFGVQNQTRMFMDNIGWVGLSNSVPFSPQSRLQVHEVTPLADNYFRLSNVATGITGGARLGQDVGGSDFRIEQIQNAEMQFWTNSTQRMTITGAGNVGINAIPTTERLYVDGIVRFENLFATLTPSTAFVGIDVNGILSQQNGSLPAAGTLLGNTLYWDNVDNQWKDNIQLQIYPGTGPGTGVGINISPNIPGAKLHVNGTVRFQNLPSITTPPFSTTAEYIGMDPLTGDLFSQPGSLPGLGSSFYNTLYWDDTDKQWKSNNKLVVDPAIGVGINLSGSPSADLHVDGIVRINNMNTSILANTYLTLNVWDEIEQQIGSLPQAGLTNGGVLYWLGGEWVPAPSNTLYIDPGGFAGVNTTAPVLPILPLTSGGPAGGGVWVTAPPAFPTANPLFSVAGDISTSGNFFGNSIYIVSDERLKQNIAELPEWKRIIEIQPYTYKYIDQKHERYSYGFLAQDVYKILPELTSGWGEALSVNYIGFIPFLSQGLQEHEERLNAMDQARQNIIEAENEINRINAEIEALEVQNIQFVKKFEELEAENLVLQNQNQHLENRLTALEEKFNAICSMPCIQNNPSPKGSGEGTGIGQSGTLNEPPSLEQNEPNPFTETTIIRYFLPEGTVNAKIEVRNAENKIVGSYTISQIGDGNITLASGTLAAGSYYYSLIVNNNIVDTKKMILLN